MDPQSQRKCQGYKMDTVSDFYVSSLFYILIAEYERSIHLHDSKA